MLNDAEYMKLKNSILALGPVLPGTLRTVRLRCNSKNCHCQTKDKNQWHGPYSYWDRKDGKQLSSRSVSFETVQLLRAWIKNRRELNRIVRKMLQQGMKMASQLNASKKEKNLSGIDKRKLFTPTMF